MATQGRVINMQPGDRKSFAGAVLGFTAGAAHMTGPLAFPAAPPEVWQALFWLSVIIMSITLVYFVLVHTTTREDRAMPISLMVVGALLFIGGSIWLGIINQRRVEARQTTAVNPPPDPPRSQSPPDTPRLSMPQDVGVLRPTKKNVLFSAAGGGAFQMLQIGPNGTTFMYLGSERNPPTFTFFERSKLLVGWADDHAIFSTQVRDNSGRLIAELIDNEWKIAPPPMTWDRNYSHDALEVKAPDGAIVLQVVVLTDMIQVQGEWWDTGGKGIKLVARPEGGSAILPLPRKAGTPDIEIRPIFRYPSALHLGERVR